MKRITAIVSGGIQNVGYRARVVGIAKKFELTGNVQNLEDDRVKIVAEGEEVVLKGFLDAIRIKNTLINVDDVDVEYSGASGEYADFYKLVGTGETDERLDKASDYLKELIVVMKNGFGEMKEEIVGVKEGIAEMRTGFETLGSKQDKTIDEIRALRGDLKSYIEWRTEKLRSELKEEMRTGFNELKRELAEQELCADVTG